LITELEKGLGSLVRRRDPSAAEGDAEGGGGDSDALAAILTPSDETLYWADVANAAKKREDRDRAAAFWTALEPVAKDFNAMEAMQLPDAEDVLETRYNSLDDLWKLDEWNYPQRRMTHLMDVIAHALARFITAKLATVDLWRAPYSKVEEALRQGVALCERWADVCQKLTSVYWPTYAPHRWSGGPYTPDHAANVRRRLEEILSLRALHKQLTQLLSNQEQEELKTGRSFEPFAKLNPVQVFMIIYDTMRSIF